MNLSICLPAVLLISLTAVILMSTVRTRPPSLPQCGHIVLVTAPRHGSTWFIDSAERCLSRRSKNANYRDLIGNTELWHKKPVSNLTVQEAVDYVRHNSSIKVFPSMFWTRGKDLEQLLRSVKALGLPVFVLNRRAQDAFGSLKDAATNGTWAVNTRGQKKENSVTVDEDNAAFIKYELKLQRYFQQAKKMMKRNGLQWDRLDYEDVTAMKMIVGHRNRCFIKNCNFVN